MNGYYEQALEIITSEGFVFYRSGKGSHKIFVRYDKNGKLNGRIQLPTHLDHKHFANILLKQAGVKGRIR